MLNDNQNQEYIKEIDGVIQQHKPLLSNNAFQFLNRVYNDGLHKYFTRLSAYGFNDFDCVLDAGCGFGQWTLALSGLNKKVYAVDASPERVRFVQDLTKKIGIQNVTVSVGKIDDLVFPDTVFDAVFCNIAIFYTPWKDTVKEFYRVLKPKGKLYVNANGFGWYKNLWYNEPNKAEDYDPKLVAAKVLLNTWRYNHGFDPEPGMDILIEPQEFESFLCSIGFTNIQRDSEGCLKDGTYSGVVIPPFFKGEYLGDLGVYEIIAYKK